MLLFFCAERHGSYDLQRLRERSGRLFEQIDQRSQVVSAAKRNPLKRERGLEHLLDGLLGMEAEHLVGTLQIAGQALEYELVLRRLSQQKLSMFTRRRQRFVPRGEPPN